MDQALNIRSGMKDFFLFHYNELSKLLFEVSAWYKQTNKHWSIYLRRKKQQYFAYAYCKDLNVLPRSNLLHQSQGFPFRNRDRSQDGAVHAVQSLPYRSDKRLTEELHLPNLVYDKHLPASVARL